MTRVELLAGGAALALVTATASLLLANGSAERTERQAFHDAKVIRDAAERWSIENPDEPGCPTISQLTHEGLLSDDSRTDDPWGERYRVSCQDGTIVVVSPGPDGRRNTDDDVRSAGGSSG